MSRSHIEIKICNDAVSHLDSYILYQDVCASVVDTDIKIIPLIFNIVKVNMYPFLLNVVNVNRSLLIFNILRVNINSINASQLITGMIIMH